MKKKSIFERISTAPDPNALKWAGKEVSILSSILLWGLWICRVLSLLQISKLIYRAIATAIKTATTDKDAKRVNVPPMFCEIYFILWLGVMILGYTLFPESLAVRIAIYYYLFESIVWVLYYTIFRRFYEESYSIYHELEYLTVLILVIPTQALGFATLYGEEFGDMLAALLGAGGDATPLPVKIVGALFAAIVISMIISSFPTERVKKREIVKMHHIIGCGDVVANRLYPALIASGVKESEIKIYTTGEPLLGATVYQDEASLTEALIKSVDSNSTVWIATPSYAHVGYLREIVGSSAGLTVVEKPIAVDRDELDFVEELVETDSLRGRIFFLSYYVIEKALPLYYLVDHNPIYNRYLTVEDKQLALGWQSLIGGVRGVEVTLDEGEDEREWVLSGEYGGQLTETFIHNVLIASLFVGVPEYWQGVEYRKSEEDGITSLSLDAMSGSATISLRMRKGLPVDKVRRTALITFEYGRIEADFDRESARVYIDNIGRQLLVSVKRAYSQKYAIITDLVRRTGEGEISPADADGLINQIATLRWLIGIEASESSSDI